MSKQIDDKPKRSVGRPPKTDPDSPETIKKKIEEQQNLFGAKCADNLHRLYGVMFDTALKDIKGVSATNKLSATKYCLEYADNYLKANPEEGAKDFDLDEDEDDGPLLSLVSYND